MDKIYKKLARKLDEIPNGFPATGSGVELKILAELFSPRQAQIACCLELTARSADAVAQKENLARGEVFSELKGMYKKGLIEMERGEGKLLFKLLPFVVGFYERQNGDISRKFALLFEQYYQESLYKIMNARPPLHRVIPVEQAVPFKVEILPYQKGSAYLEEAQSWGVLPCICRVQRSLIGEDCGHSKENCLVFAGKPDAFRRVEKIKDISLKEAKEILKEAAEEGLIHSINNVVEGVNYICNCCTCSCGILRGIAEFGHLNSVATSDFYAEVIEDNCNGCKECIKRCQFKALTISGGTCRVNLTNCYGCGQCVLSCKFGGIILKLKENSTGAAPPKDENAWRKRRKNFRNRIENGENFSK